MEISGKLFALGLAATTLLALPAAHHESAPAQALVRTPSAEGARVYLISPSDGAKLSGPVTVLFGLEGMGVAPAGVPMPNTGHHHLILDAPQPPLDEPLPTDEHHRHFGGGQTQVSLELPAGEHTLQLVLADHNHVPHDPPVASQQIRIHVAE